MRLAILLLMLSPIYTFAQLADCEGVILHGKKDFVLRWDSDTTTIQKALWQVFGKKNVDVVRDYPSQGHIRWNCFLGASTDYSFHWSPAHKMYFWEYSYMPQINEKNLPRIAADINKMVPILTRWYADQALQAPKRDSSLREYLEGGKYAEENEIMNTYRFLIACSSEATRYVKIRQTKKPVESGGKLYVSRKVIVSFFESDLETP